MNIYQDRDGYWWYESKRFDAPVGPFGSRRTALHDAQYFDKQEVEFEEGGEA